jgi:hypothetical protein
MLIAADIAKGEPGNSAAGNALKIERASATGKDLDRITACPDQEDRAIGKKDFVLIDAGSDKDLIELSGLFQRRTRPGIERGILPIYDQRLPAERIRRRILRDRF